MTRLLSPVLADLGAGRVGFWCPGCNEPHQIPVADQHRPGVNWGWDGNAEKPTFTPSVLDRSGHYVPEWQGKICYCHPQPDGEEWGFRCSICHSFVTDGRIIFLSDCTHELAGQTVDLPPYPAEWL